MSVSRRFRLVPGLLACLALCLTLFLTEPGGLTAAYSGQAAMMKKTSGMNSMPGMNPAGRSETGGRESGADHPSRRSPGPYKLSIDDSPPPIGQGEIVVHVRDRATGEPISNGTVIVKASMPSMPMGETFKEARPVPGHEGEFRTSWPFVMAGDWIIQAEFRGPKGSDDASVHVSPGAIPFTLWAKALLALIGLALAGSILKLARTRGGRERLRSLVTRKNLLALLVLLGVAVGSWLLVRKLTAGKIDWNAMSMQMEDYTAPTPVAVDPIRYGAVSGALTYTGTVAPFIEDTIYPRVTGRIVQTLYPGDRVVAGEVIVRMEQPDLSAKAEQARFATVGAEHDVLEAQYRLRQAQDALATARAAEQGSRGAVQEAQQGQIGAGSGVAQAESELQAARADYQAARADVDQSKAAVRQAQARLASAAADQAYWQKEIPREAALLSRGAVSQDEYQSELAKSQAADAAVDDARATIANARAAVLMAEARVQQTTSKIAAEQAALRGAIANRGGQAAKVSEAQAASVGSNAGIASAAHGVELARQEVTHARARLAEVRAAQAAAEANLDYLTIRAPESGVVTVRLADPGTVASPGTGILKIAQLDRMRLQANVSTADLNQIHPGTPVTATIQGEEPPIEARVTDIFPAASDVTRTSIVEAVIPNPGNRLLPGTFATLQFHTMAGRNALVVPLTAVVSLAEASGGASASEGASSGQAGSGVWVARDGTAHLVPVTLGANDGTHQEILSGLKESDLVIVSGIEGLTEGAPITYPGMPRLAPASGQTSETTKAGAGGMVAHAGSLTLALSLSPSPPQVGQEQLRFTVTDASGSLVKSAAVSVTSEMPAMSMGGPSGVAKDNGDGTYTMPLTMSMGGDWRITASVTPAGQSVAKAVFNLKVG